MITKDPCECVGCSEARLLATWCVLEEASDPQVRVSARLLLSRWERLLLDGEHPTVSAPRQHELEALQACATWIRQHQNTLARMHRHVGVSGRVLDK